jgi:protein-disulfide isomerase
MTKGFSLLLAICVIAFGVIFFIKKDSGGNKSNGAALSAHRIGAGNKKVELVEYGDFSCPYCGQFYPVEKQIRAKYGDDIVFQFRHYPLIDAHPNAMSAARAAEAASRQGKFWEFHDLLYSNQTDWNPAQGEGSRDPIPYFEKYAADISLDITKYKTDFADASTTNTINADKSEGTKLKVTGTPTIFLNGAKVEYPSLSNPQAAYNFFVQKIDEEIAKQNPSASASPVSSPTSDTTPTTSPTPAQ